MKHIDSERDSFDTLRRKRWCTTCSKICLAIIEQLCGCILKIGSSRKLKQIPVRDMRRWRICILGPDVLPGPFGIIFVMRLIGGIKMYG